MSQIKGLRRPKEGRFHTMCQLVTQSRMAGFTLGITAENVRPNSNCGGVHGIDLPDAPTLDGTHMTGVWFENQEAAAAHQDQMPRQVYGTYQATVVSPLRASQGVSRIPTIGRWLGGSHFGRPRWDPNMTVLLGHRLVAVHLSAPLGSLPPAVWGIPGRRRRRRRRQGGRRIRSVHGG